MKPLVLCVGTGVDIFANVPSHVCKRKFEVVFLFVVHFGLVEQQEQVPVAAFVVVATGTGAVEVEGAAWGKHFAGHLLDVFYHLSVFHDDLFTEFFGVSSVANVQKFCESNKKVGIFCGFCEFSGKSEGGKTAQEGLGVPMRRLVILYLPVASK